MPKKMRNSDMPQGKITVIPDFLPPPAELAIPHDTVRVTLYLTRGSVNFLKEQARKHHTKYQKMLRAVVDSYVERYRPK